VGYDRSEALKSNSFNRALSGCNKVTSEKHDVISHRSFEAHVEGQPTNIHIVLIETHTLASTQHKRTRVSGKSFSFPKLSTPFPGYQTQIELIDAEYGQSGVDTYT
jgi:hypothetical protein